MCQPKDDPSKTADPSGPFTRLPQGLLINPPPEEGGEESLFRVVYLIDVNAANPRDAAGFVHRIMSNPDAQAPVLQMIDHTGGITEIDLSNEDESQTRPEPTKANKGKPLNLAKIIYDAYPDSDLLPIDPKQDCSSLWALKDKVCTANIGDGLFRFLVIEIDEGGEGTVDGAIRVLRRAARDVDAVLRGLCEARGTFSSRKGGSNDLSHSPKEGSTSHEAQNTTPQVILFVRGGTPDVLFKPRDIAVTIIDYDVGGEDGDADHPLDTDPDGKPCHISKYPATEQIDSHPHWPIIDEANRCRDSESHLITFLTSGGFVVLNGNGDKKTPEKQYEAWAYRGPLDFDHANPIRFGLGADPHQALASLSFQLSRHVSSAPV